MTEDEAGDWIAGASGVPREAIGQLADLASIIVRENQTQNLISPGTVDSFISRHIVDSLQLGSFAPQPASWADIGSGGGLPGLPLACAHPKSLFTLIEPRRLRADFLQRTAAELSLANIAVVQAKAEGVTGCFDVITARAVAPPAHLISMTRHLAHKETIWVLPAGRSAEKALKDLRRSWQGRFHVEPSVTDPESGIIIASHVEGRRK